MLYFSVAKHIEANAKSPTIRTLKIICDALDITIEDFFVVREPEEIPERHKEAIMVLTPRQQEALIRIVKHINEKRGRPFSA